MGPEPSDGVLVRSREETQRPRKRRPGDARCRAGTEASRSQGMPKMAGRHGSWERGLEQSLLEPPAGTDPAHTFTSVR